MHRKTFFRELVACRLGAILAASFITHATAQQIVVVTTANAAQPPPAGANGDSVSPCLTPDGRFVLFASTANNLLATNGNTPGLTVFPPRRQVFLRDRLNGTTTLVSVNPDGSTAGNGRSLPLGISTNGQFALFMSEASNLVPGDTNKATDIFVRDLVNGVTLLVSANTNGIPGNAAALSPVMTPDGRFVAFSSTATDLVPGGSHYAPDVYVRDLQISVTRLVSPPPGFPGLSSADGPAISPDGRYVAYLSVTNVPISGVYASSGIFISDLMTGSTLSASDAAEPLLTLNPIFSFTQYPYFATNGLFTSLAFNAQGNYLVFSAIAGSSYQGDSWGSLFRYHLASGAIDLIATNAWGPRADFAHFHGCDISPDGQKVAYINLVSAPFLDLTQISVWDNATGSNALVSADLAHSLQNETYCDFPTLDASARFVTFTSTATNLTPAVVSPSAHFYRCDLQTGTLELLDISTNGTTANGFCAAVEGMTPDGRFVAFDSTAEDLVSADGNWASDVFVRDLAAQTNELISVRQPALVSGTLPTSSLGSLYNVSANGQFIAVNARLRQQLPANVNTRWQAMVFDAVNGTNTCASLNTNGLPCAAGTLGLPSLSTDGRFVAFTSASTDLAPGDNNNATDVFVRDLATGTTSLASAVHGGTASGNYFSISPVVSTNGQSLVFTSQAINLTPDSMGFPNVFWRNLQTHTTYSVTRQAFANYQVTPDLRFVAVAFAATAPFKLWDATTTNYIYTSPVVGSLIYALSADGKRIAYANASKLNIIDRTTNAKWSPAALASAAEPPQAQFSPDGRFLLYQTLAAVLPQDHNGVNDVYLYDTLLATNQLISLSLNGTAAGHGASDSASFSPNGRFIVFHSTATDLVPNDNNGQGDIFLYDRQTGLTTLLSENAAGSGPGNYESTAPAFSGDGQTVVFKSWATDLVAGDLNQGDDFFTVKIFVADPAGVLVGQILFAPGPGQNPTITWPAINGKSYALQYKNSIRDPVWRNLNVPVTVTDTQGSATDTTANSGQRFYRVIAF